MSQIYKLFVNLRNFFRIFFDKRLKKPFFVVICGLCALPILNIMDKRLGLISKYSSKAMCCSSIILRSVLVRFSFVLRSSFFLRSSFVLPSLDNRRSIEEQSKIYRKNNVGAWEGLRRRNEG